MDAPRLLVLLLLLLLATPARAGEPPTPDEKGATKSLLSAQKQALAELRGDLSSALVALRQGLPPIEAALADGADPDEQAGQLFERLVELQAAASAAARAAADAQGDAAQGALAELVPAVEGVYPPAFLPGLGTPTAVFERAVDRELARVASAAGKRLRRTLVRFEQAGTHVALRLLPAERPARIWTSTVVDFFVAPTVGIDLVLAWSGAAAAGDGHLRVGGRASSFQLSGDVSLIGAATAVGETTATATPADERYSADLGSDLPEGVWLLGATQDGLAPATATIGIR